MVHTSPPLVWCLCWFVCPGMPHFITLRVNGDRVLPLQLCIFKMLMHMKRGTQKCPQNALLYFRSWLMGNRPPIVFTFKMLL